MDNRGLGFSNNCPSNAFRRLGDLYQVEGSSHSQLDTILCLDPHSSSSTYAPTPKGTKRKWSCMNRTMGQQVDPLLCLGLGNSSNSSDSKGSSATACTAMSFPKETDVESTMDLDLDFTLHLGSNSDKSPSPKKYASSSFTAYGKQPNVDLELSLSTGPSESDVTSVHQGSTLLQNRRDVPLPVGGSHMVDDESASSHSKPEVSLPPFFTQNVEPNIFFKPIPGKIVTASMALDFSASVATAPKSSVTCSSGITQRSQLQQRGSSKICKFAGCTKGARGASGLCIAHGGGRRCQRQGCHKGAEGRTAFCKAHGGGRRCEFFGCTKSAEGRTDFCIAHGGGRRCSQEGCTRAARGKSGLCIRHGGGKRCQMENCTRSAEGLSGLCISHGGGRRCHYPSCTKGAQGSTMFCKAHGGGKRCTVDGCNKGAEGSTPFCKGHGGGKRCSFPSCPKSVHGGTSFCVAHGGGKRCAVPGCTKSARGRTDFCVRHGGGKRCKFEGCGKSAQGSTDFCKAHGGGRRCSWGQPDSLYGHASDGPCGSFARGKTGLCAMHGALVQDNRVHGGVTVGPIVQSPLSAEPDRMTGVTAESMNVVNGCSGIISAAGTTGFEMNVDHRPSAVPGPSLVPEGRVHGGSLMAILKGHSRHSSSTNDSHVGEPSLRTSSPTIMPQSWV